MRRRPFRQVYTTAKMRPLDRPDHDVPPLGIVPALILVFNEITVEDSGREIEVDLTLAKGPLALLTIIFVIHDACVQRSDDRWQASQR